MLHLPGGGHIEYCPNRPTIKILVRRLEAAGYHVIVQWQWSVIGTILFLRSRNHRADKDRPSRTNHPASPASGASSTIQLLLN